MATPDQVQEFLSVIDAMTKTPTDALVSNQQKWGAIGFESARRDLDVMFGLGRHIGDLPIAIVPDELAKEFLRLFNLANSAMQRITAFTIESGNAIEQRDEIVAQIHQSTEQLLNAAKAMYKEGIIGSRATSA